MSAGAKARRSGDERAAAAAVRRRGLQIFALAFLFRFQSFVLSHSPAWTLLRVDILNIMGPSIVAGIGLWLVFRGTRARVVAFGTATAALVLITPAIRTFAWVTRLPDALEAYVRPIPLLSNFTFFPWAAFVMAGGVVGVVLDGAREKAADRHANVGFLAAGSLMAFAAYQASFRPPLHPQSSFWTTSASFFFIRLGLMIAAVGVAWLWEQRPGAGRRWSPLQLLGRTSLFIYWIHVELVYGLISTPLHGAFSLPAAWAALAVFCALMLCAAVAKENISRKRLEKRKLRGKLNRQAQALML